MQPITFPKPNLSLKSIHGNRKYLRFYSRKHVKPNEIHILFSSIGFWSISHVFWHKIEDISGFRGWILMKDSVLETLWVVFFMIKFPLQSFTNFIAKFGSKVEIFWESARYIRDSQITLLFQVICWDIYYFSERLWCRLSNMPQKITKLALCKKLIKD